MKNYFFFMLFALSSLFVQGQDLDFGIKAGANFATINDASGFSNTTGFVGGVFLGFKLGETWGMQADLLYSQQGGDFTLGAINLDYMNIPVVLKYYMTDNLNIHAGPQIGINVNDNVDDVLPEITEGIDLADPESFNVDGVVGLGYDFPFGLRASMRYSFGLTEAFNTGGKNSVITLAAGYSFL